MPASYLRHWRTLIIVNSMVNTISYFYNTVHWLLDSIRSLQKIVKAHLVSLACRLNLVIKPKEFKFNLAKKDFKMPPCCLARNAKQCWNNNKRLKMHWMLERIKLTAVKIIFANHWVFYLHVPPSLSSFFLSLSHSHPPFSLSLSTYLSH